MKSIFKTLGIGLSLIFLFTTETYAQKVISETISTIIHVQSNPNGAQVYMDGKLVCESTPGTINIRKDITINTSKEKYDDIFVKKAIKDNTIKLQFVKEGYITGEEEIIPDISIERLPKIGTSLNVEYPTIVTHRMTKQTNTDDESKKNYNRDTSMPKGAESETVNRDNPGATSLESTVLRWYFETEPQGARIFWRVISSCPEQVKNTNETWLGNTPYEETRSFDIMGLTYENSRNVQIEIKVRKSGYLDQTKRFNVRQAIDQQEISSFFDMIKKDE